MAERKRFELLVPFRAHTISNRAPSANSDTSPQETLNYQNEKVLARLKFHFSNFKILFPASRQKYSGIFPRQLKRLKKDSFIALERPEYRACPIKFISNWLLLFLLKNS